jgi:SAM-dependent methyltransferase
VPDVRPEAASYDAVPYPSHAFARTAPDRLAVVGRVFGMPTAPPDRARVLEIGCAAGGNLLPLAAASPEGTFVGIDLSPRQIADGEAIRRGLGLTNATLLVADVATWRPEPGSFDYVICHGVYAWVGDEVRRAILEVCATALAPGGVACVSTNVSPGWRMLGGLRDALVSLVSPGDDRELQAASARHVLDVLATGLARSSSPWRKLVDEVRQHADHTTESYLLHEYLDAHHRPAPLARVVEEARAAGLRYLGDSSFTEMLPHLAPAPVRERLAALATDVVSTEQALDWLRGRSFRHLLLVRGDERLDRDLGHFDPTGFHVVSRAVGRPDEANPGRVAWYPSDDTAGAPAWATDPPWLTDLLVRAIRAWPVPLDFDALVAPTLDTVAADDAAARSAWRHRLGQILLYAHGLGLVSLHRTALAPVGRAGERPVVWSWARAEALRRSSVTTLRHETVVPPPLAARLLVACDGTRTRDELTALVRDEALGRLGVTGESAAVPSREDVDAGLAWLTLAPLMVG